MKRLFVVFLAALCVLSSCSLFKGTDPNEEAIAASREDAIAAIKEAQTKAVSDAKESISSIIAKAVEGASEDISLTINEAKNEIQKSAEESVNKSLNEKFNKYDSDLKEAHRTAVIAAIIALVSLIVSIGFFILMMGRTSRNEVIETIEGSRRIKDLINTTIEKTLDSKQYIRREDIKNVVETDLKRNLASPEVSQFLAHFIEAYLDNKVKVAQRTNPGKETGGRVEQGPTRVQPKVELYAKDSPDNVLSGVTSTYQQGISIYRLVLTSPDAQTAEISVCTDMEQVKSRVLKLSNDLLEPICRVDRKKSNPKELSNVTIQAGKAEKISTDTWKVTEPIYVELS